MTWFNIFFYKKIEEFYPAAVVDVYDRSRKEKYSTIMKIDYGINGQLKTFRISKKKMARVCGIPHGSDKEQQPKGNKSLSDWCTKVILGASIIGSIVRLSGMFRNQLSLHAFIFDNLIPGECGLNKRQFELLYVLQKRIELKGDVKLGQGERFLLLCA